MQCPYCKQDNDRVVDSRSAPGRAAIRRRRQCVECDRRFTTFERVEMRPIRVVKKDDSRVPFDREKILRGLTTACEKRPVPQETLEAAVDKIEMKCHEVFDREVRSAYIGGLVMEELKMIDQVAYVRFASVYREFKDVEQFLTELRPMLEKDTAPR